MQGYCLMPNPAHLVVVPGAEASLGATIKPLNMRYTQHVNRVHGLGGRLWQGRFFSCPLDGEHLRAAVRYVERNPVRAGMADRPESYRWSSAAPHCGLREDAVLSDPCELLPRLRPEQWSQWLREPWEQEAAMTERLRKCTYSGRPPAERASCRVWKPSSAARCAPASPAARGSTARTRRRRTDRQIDRKSGSVPCSHVTSPERTAAGAVPEGRSSAVRPKRSGGLGSGRSA